MSLASNLVISLSSGTSLAISGNIAGAGKSLTLAYGGSLLLSGSNTYNGPTLVSGGSLTLTTGGAISGTSSFTVQGGATYTFINTFSGPNFGGGLSSGKCIAYLIIGIAVLAVLELNALGMISGRGNTGLNMIYETHKNAMYTGFALIVGFYVLAEIMLRS